MAGQPIVAYNYLKEDHYVLKERLIKQRTAKRLSQYDLARLLGLSRGQISNYELGTRRPDYETLTKLADFFGVSVSNILKKIKVHR